MPIEIHRYRCEGCLTEYDSELRAAECEQKHIVATDIEESTYNQLDVFPESLVVQFENGTRYRYYRNKGH